MRSAFHGIVPAMATPFDDQFKMDEAAVGDLIDWYIDSGVHGISVAGSQGEFFAMNFEERLRLIKIASQKIDGRVPLYAGTGCVSTTESIRLTQAAEAEGANLAMLITPYFVSPSAEELYEHYRDIAKATALPVMLYNNPPRTGVNISVDAYVRCFELDNVVGIKDSSGDLTQMVEYYLRTNEQSLIFAGRDTLIFSLLMHGGSGAISPAANVFPRLLVRFYDLVQAGRLEEARRISDALAPLRAAWAWGSFPVVIKETMALTGRSAGPARPPIQGLSSERREQLRAVVARIQKLELEEPALAT